MCVATKALERLSIPMHNPVQELKPTSYPLIGRNTGFSDILTNHVSLTQSNIDKILIFCTFVKIFAVVSFYRTQAKKSKRKRYWVHPLIAIEIYKRAVCKIVGQIPLTVKKKLSVSNPLVDIMCAL